MTNLITQKHLNSVSCILELTIQMCVSSCLTFPVLERESPCVASNYFYVKMTSDKHHRKMVSLRYEFLCGHPVHVDIGMFSDKRSMKLKVPPSESSYVDPCFFCKKTAFCKYHKKRVYPWYVF